MTPPSFSPTRIAGIGRQRPSPSLFPSIWSTAREWQRRVSRSRGSPYPDSSPSRWGTRSCRTGRNWDSWLQERLGRGRRSSRAFSFPRASWRETAAAATTQAAATAAGARELASASALLPLINTAGRRGCTGAGTRRERGQGRVRAGALPGRLGAARGRVPGGAAGPGVRAQVLPSRRRPGEAPASPRVLPALQAARSWSGQTSGTPGLREAGKPPASVEGGVRTS